MADKAFKARSLMFFHETRRDEELIPDALLDGLQDRCIIGDKHRTGSLAARNDSVHKLDRVQGERGKKMISYSVDAELPELVVFFQESNYQFVKKTCIDKEETSQGKSLEGNCELESLPCLNSDAYSGSESASETEDTASSTVSSESKPAAEGDYIQDAAGGCSFNTMLFRSKAHFHARDRHPLTKFLKQMAIPEAFTLNTEAPSVEAMASPATIEVLEDHRRNEATAKTQFQSQNRQYESSTGTSTVSSDPQHHTGNGSSRLPENQTASFRAQPEETHVGFDNKNRRGESSEPLSAPPPHCGSTSLRSNSSTNSSRSFAFPIIPSEWTGSPVRMADAERGQMRRHGRWRIFLCCKF